MKSRRLNILQFTENEGHLIATQQINERTLVQAVFTESLKTGFGELAKKYLSARPRHSIFFGVNWVVLLPQGKVLLQFGAVAPPEAEADRSGGAERVKDLLPYPSEEMFFEFLPGDDAKTILAAVLKKDVEPCLEILRSFSSYPSIVSVSSWGWLGFYPYLLRPLGNDASILIKREGRHCEIGFRKPARVLFSREILLPSCENEKLAQSWFVQQINLTFLAFRQACPIRKVQAIFIVGNEAAGLKNIFEENWEWPVSVVNMEAVLEKTGLDFLPDVKIAEAIWPALGFLLLPAEKQEQLNFWPRSERARCQDSRRKKLGMQLSVAVVLALLLNWSVFQAGIYFYQGRLKEIERRVSRTKPQAELAKKHIEFLTVFDQERLSPAWSSPAIKQIYAAMPPGAWVRSLRFSSDNEVTLDLFTVDLEKLKEFKKALVESGNVTDIQAQEFGVVNEFQLTCRFGKEKAHGQ